MLSDMRRLTFIAAVSLLLTACATSTHPRGGAAAVPMPYMRVINADSNTVQLQIAVRRFVPAYSAGPVVWLVGAAHLGEPDYYYSLQRLLDAQTLVLYEGIGPHPAPGNEPAKPPDSNENTNSDSGLGSLQQTAAKSLGLVFQLDAIDYDRPNFRNSDLSIQDIQALLAKPSQGGPAAGQEFQGLIQMMQGGTFLSRLINTVFEYIGTDPKLRGSARLVLIEVLGGLRGDLSQIQGLPPDMKRLLQTLIQSRNQKVLADLKQAIRTLPRKSSVAIFYGTGHMDNLETQLTGGLRYHPAGEQWYTAFSVNLAQAGITPAEAEMIRWFARQQMQQLQSPAAVP
jgi:hypothetical protein